jgi:hypothetical protein
MLKGVMGYGCDCYELNLDYDQCWPLVFVVLNLQFSCYGISMEILHS